METLSISGTSQVTHLSPLVMGYFRNIRIFFLYGTGGLGTNTLRLFSSLELPKKQFDFDSRKFLFQ